MITGKKVLGAAAPIFGHTTPVLKLALDLRRTSNEARMICFGGRMRDLFERYDVGFDPMQQMTTAKKVRAMCVILDKYAPDITICDWSPEMWFALRARRPPCRVSILRCELLPGYKRRSPFLPDKFGFESGASVTTMNDVLRELSLEPVDDPREMYEAEIVVVPSIPEIDPLPDGLGEFYPNTQFIYTGPLLLQIAAPIHNLLREWINARRREGIVVMLITLGTVWGAGIYRTLVDSLIQLNLAIIMIVPASAERESLAKYNGPRFQVTDLTDLSGLIELADVVMHHCGHATMQATLLAGKPSITLPSGKYDREDNALRLEDLQCGRHLGHDFFDQGINNSRMCAAIRDVMRDDSICKGIDSISRKLRKLVDGDGSENFARAIASKFPQ